MSRRKAGKPRTAVSLSLLDPAIVKVRCDGAVLIATLADGRDVTMLIDRIPGLRHATADQRAHWRLIGRGEGIHWDDIDEDVSVDVLLKLANRI